MAKNSGNGKWTITDDDPGELRDGKTREFSTRREAAAYAASKQAAGAHALIVTTPDGRSGTLGKRSRWF